MSITVVLALALMPAPTAIVDSVSGRADLAPLQLLAPGTVIALDDDSRIRIAYFASCVHETVRGGRLRVGVTASLTVDALIERVSADCSPPRYGAARAAVPGALVLRDRGRRHDTPQVWRLRTRTPVLLAPPGSRVELQRMRPLGRQLFVSAQDGRADLAALGLALEPEAVYRICSESYCRRVWIDPDGEHHRGPVLERVVRLP